MKDMTKKVHLGQALEEDLDVILEKSKQAPITVEIFLKTLAGRGYPFLAFLFSLPFCQPIQIPGFSTPFGIVIVFIGLRMAFGHRLWWPQWILKKKIPTRLLEVIAKKSQWLLKKLHTILRPRLIGMSNGWWAGVLNGLMIAGMGLFLALPLPIPLSNFIAAWGIAFLTLGIIGDDGIFILIGYLLALACLLVTIFLIVASAHFLALV
jgi:hypothetical protein